MESKKLLVFYSYTGHTKYIAEKIKQKIDCDLLELKPKVKYSKDYNEVLREHPTPEYVQEPREIEPINIDVSKYDGIILGSPVWWYTIAPVMKKFLLENDFTNKTIIPFATNAGWLGNTFKDIKKLCPNSNVKKEMNIVFSEDYTVNELVTLNEDIEKWLNEIVNN